jgi:hypothetical protein
MYEWIIEADIVRFRKALAETNEPLKRQKLITCLNAAEARLGGPTTQRYEAPRRHYTF